MWLKFIYLPLVEKKISTERNKSKTKLDIQYKNLVCELPREFLNDFKDWSRQIEAKLICKSFLKNWKIV